ncbi:hypothetical protein LWI29_025456 [Acer saccharum]|uniref:Uncharacterized protein n=1 Tax=Acer saccharum TaxID=4024 RepID=A0AA39SW37_ACESA|nr:hypothetical protein LWI29_025456 [Acer saccharum]
MGTLIGWVSITKRNAYMHGDWAETEVDNLKVNGALVAEQIIMSLSEESRPRLVALSSALKIKAGGTDQEIRERLIAKLRGGSTNSEGKALEKKNPDKMILLFKSLTLGIGRATSQFSYQPFSDFLICPTCLDFSARALKIKAGGTDQEIRARLIAKLRGGSTNSEGKALEKKNPDKMFEIALLECKIKELCVLLKVLKIKAGGTDQEIRERLIAKLRGGSTNFEGKALEKKNPDKMFEIALLECKIKKLCVLLKV